MRELKVCYDPLKSRFISKQSFGGAPVEFYFSSKLNLGKFEKAIAFDQLIYNCKLDKFVARYGMQIEYDMIKMLATYVSIEKRIFRMRNVKTCIDYMKPSDIPFRIVWGE